MSQNDRTMKEKRKIPTKVIRLYQIHKKKNRIFIHRPAFISISNPTVEVGQHTVEIDNKYVSVNLWLGSLIMHVTIRDEAIP